LPKPPGRNGNKGVVGPVAIYIFFRLTITQIVLVRAVRKTREPYDYDPGHTRDATATNLAIVAAQEVIKEFRAGTSDQQQAFLIASAPLPTARSGRGKKLIYPRNAQLLVCPYFSPSFSIA
jgi:hypothetical protein